MWGRPTKLRQADILFSQYIREKSGWKCEYCHKDFSHNRQRLQCSHYWGRRREATRYEPDNCMALCAFHHHYLGHGDGRDEYRQLMVNRLGQARFDSLMLQAHTTVKRDDALSLLYAKQLLKDL